MREGWRSTVPGFHSGLHRGGLVRGKPGHHPNLGARRVEPGTVTSGPGDGCADPRLRSMLRMVPTAESRIFPAGIEIDARAVLALADLLHNHGLSTPQSHERGTRTSAGRAKTRRNNLHRPAPSSSRSTSAASATGWCNDGRTGLEGGVPGIHIEWLSPASTSLPAPPRAWRFCSTALGNRVSHSGSGSRLTQTVVVSVSVATSGGWCLLCLEIRPLSFASSEKRSRIALDGAARRGR